MNQKVLNELANTFSENAKNYFFGNASNLEQFTQMFDLFGCIIEQLQRTENGLILPLMRIVAHYAATSTDPDKKAVIDKITQPNGVCVLLERVEAGGEIIGVWADAWETLSDRLADIETDEKQV